VTETIAELVARGYSARSEKRFADSRAAFLEAVRKAAIETDRLSLAQAFCGLTHAERDIGNPNAASHHYANAAVLYRELKQPERLAYAIRHEPSRFIWKLKESSGKSTKGAMLDLANTL
jgi:hypothetical protein